MIRSGGAQSILISGESGAGKTEATKLCMACLADISGSSGKGTEAALESGILLEAFGNAKTVCAFEYAWPLVRFSSMQIIRQPVRECLCLSSICCPPVTSGAQQQLVAFWQMVLNPF